MDEWILSWDTVGQRLTINLNWKTQMWIKHFTCCPRVNAWSKVTTTFLRVDLTDEEIETSENLNNNSFEEVGNASRASSPSNTTEKVIFYTDDIQLSLNPHLPSSVKSIMWSVIKVPLLSTLSSPFKCTKRSNCRLRSLRFTKFKLSIKIKVDLLTKRNKVWQKRT